MLHSDTTEDGSRLPSMAAPVFSAADNNTVAENASFDMNFMLKDLIVFLMFVMTFIIKKRNYVFLYRIDL